MLQKLNKGRKELLQVVEPEGYCNQFLLFDPKNVIN
jgi:hypothetical protein